MNINIAIAEDHQLVRKGICELIHSFEGMQVIFEAENGKVLMDHLDTLSIAPHLVLLDWEMPVMNGNETLQLLRKKFPQVYIIVLTMYESNQFILHALKLGAHAYLLKDDEPEELKNAILGVMENGYYFTDKVSKVMMMNIAKENKPKMPLNDTPSKREMDVLRLICKGLSSKEIGEKLFIATKTVEGHKENLRLKLGARNTASLLISAIRNGLIDVHEC